MELANVIKKYRKLNNWSQDELANILNVSRQSVSKWESAKIILR
ncbi:transcriptional regulator with XRE-family HTH domain [Staphylococcus hominis]|nr:helix-turn-helix transcriptional regulator [Staphylococcus hominis]